MSIKYDFQNVNLFAWTQLLFGSNLEWNELGFFHEIPQMIELGEQYFWLNTTSGWVPVPEGSNSLVASLPCIWLLLPECRYLPALGG